MTHEEMHYLNRWNELFISNCLARDRYITIDVTIIPITVCCLVWELGRQGFTAVKEGLRKSAKTRSFFVNNLDQGALFQGSEAFSHKEKIGIDWD
jgi:hypothetical protein